MKQTIHIYIADDHQIVIDGISLFLKEEHKMIIVGTATNGQTAYEQIISLKPDIALLDLRMPEKDGLDIIKLLVNKTPTRFIILSMHQEKRILTDAINYNAYAYLLKNVGRQELIDTIYKVANGEKVFNMNIDVENDKEHTFLSPRETDVLRLIIDGLTTNQIAERLNLSPYTVGTHRKNLMRKAQANNVSLLINWVNENHIL